MPYVAPSVRSRYDYLLNKIIDVLAEGEEESLAGEMNYCFSKIAWGLFEKRRKYVRINTINGVFTSAQQEFARRKVAPYEDEKIQANGDI